MSDGRKRVDRVKPRVEQLVLLILKIGSTLGAESISVIDAVQSLHKGSPAGQDVVILSAEIVDVAVEGISGSAGFVLGLSFDCSLMERTQSA